MSPLDKRYLVNVLSCHMTPVVQEQFTFDINAEMCGFNLSYFSKLKESKQHLSKDVLMVNKVEKSL